MNHLLKFAIALGLTLSTPSFAADCPWAGATQVDVSSGMTWVTVNGTHFSVRGSRARQEFQSVLAACDATSASYSFDRWRANRRATNATLALGIIVFWPVLLVSPFTALAAGAQHDQTVAAIRSSKPPA